MENLKIEKIFVRDKCKVVEDKECKTLEEAYAWKSHLMEWQVYARPYIDVVKE